MAELAGRRVLVTGASSGIGAATARACAAAGARVAIVARRAEQLADLAEEISAVACPADLSDEDAARSAVDGCVDALGGLDGLVNNAGVMLPSPISEGRIDDWRTMIDVNVLGLLVVTHAALGHLRAAERADIVNISSLSGRRVPNPAAAVYAATKFAVHAVTEGLRQELHDDGVRVTVVAPGLVDSGLFEGQEHEAAAQLRDATERIGLSPEDVAREVVGVLARPPHVLLREVVVSPTAQSS